MRASEAQRAGTCTLRPLGKRFGVNESRGPIREQEAGLEGSEETRRRHYQFACHRRAAVREAGDDYYRRPLVECHGGDKEESSCNSATHLYESGCTLKLLEVVAHLWVSLRVSGSTPISRNDRARVYRRRSMYE